MNGHAILIDNARVLTLEGPPGPRSGPWHDELGVIEEGWVFARNGTIEAVGKGQAPQLKCTRENLSGGRRFGLGADANLDRLSHPRVLDGQREPNPRMVRASQRTVLFGDSGSRRGHHVHRSLGPRRQHDRTQRRFPPSTDRHDFFGHGDHRSQDGLRIGTGSGTQNDALAPPYRNGNQQQIFSHAYARHFLGAHAIDREHPNYVEHCIQKMLPKILEELSPASP